MSASNAFETSLLQLIFNATTLGNLAQDIAGSPSGLDVLYVSLHTSDPGEAGSQNTNECAYTGYLRVAVARTVGGWTVSGNSVSNTSAVTFPTAAGGSETATHFGIGASPTGAGTLYLSGALNSSLAISNNIQPNFSAGQLTTTCD